MTTFEGRLVEDFHGSHNTGHFVNYFFYHTIGARSLYIGLDLFGKIA